MFELVRYVIRSFNLRVQVVVYLFFARIYSSIRKKLRYIPHSKGHKQLEVYLFDSIVGKFGDSTLPDLHPALRWFQRISTSYMIYTCLRPLLRYFFELHIKPQAYCYLVGRMRNLTGGPIPDVFSASLAFCHLLWRYRMFRKKLNIHVIPFMLMDKRILRSYEEKEVDIDEDDDEEGEFNEHESYLTEIMSFQVRIGEDKVLLRRANRLESARQELALSMKRVLSIASISIGLIALVVAPIIVVEIFTDSGYLERYPGCSPELEDLKRKGILTASSVTLRGHKLLAILVDTFENLLVWFDTAWAMLALAFADFLNHDLLICWNSIHIRLVRYANWLKLNNSIYGKENHLGHRTLKENERSICYLQSEVNDFFLQLREANSYVSDTLSMGLLIWASTILTYIVSYEEIRNNRNTSNIYLLQVLFCSSMSIESWFLLRLHRNLTHSYVKICSVVALDKSKQKIRFLQVLEYFTEGKRSSYTLINGHPYVTTTLLSIVGWSFSSVILAETYFSRLKS